MTRPTTGGEPEPTAAGHAVVTGGASGIGLAVVRRRLARGAAVTVLDTDLAEWRRLMDVHLFGTWAACRAFAGQFLDRSDAGGGPADGAVLAEGAVVTVSSMVSFGGAFATQLGYGTAKAAIAYLTKVLAVERAALGIRVNSVAPGFTATPMVEDMIAHGYDLGPTEARTPMGRLARPEETARAIEFLLYDAGFVTGTVLPVDGGWTAAGR